MPQQQIQNLIEQNLPNTKLYISGSGCDLTLNIISDELITLSAVKRQQQIYQVLQPLITSGTVHAVNMNFFSSQDWMNKQNG